VRAFSRGVFSGFIEKSGRQGVLTHIFMRKSIAKQAKIG
jgi:hypothetical protein